MENTIKTVKSDKKVLVKQLKWSNSTKRWICWYVISTLGTRLLINILTDKWATAMSRDNRQLNLAKEQLELDKISDANSSFD